MGVITKNKITLVPTQNEQQQGMMSDLGTYLQQSMDKGVSSYTGDLSAGLDPAEVAALNKATSNLNNGLSSTDQASIATYLKLLDSGNADNVYSNYMKYRAPAEAAYLKNTTLPTIKESMVSGGTLRGTGTERAIAGAVTDSSNAQLTRIADAIASGQQLASSTLGYAGQINDLENQTSEINTASTLGGVARQVKQDSLTRDLEEWKRVQPENSPLIDKMLSYLNIQTQSAVLTPGNKDAIMASNASKLTPFV
jgi:hypothetical protein